MSIGPFEANGQWYRVETPGRPVDITFVGPERGEALELAFQDAQGNRISFPSPYLRYYEISGPGGACTGTPRTCG